MGKMMSSSILIPIIVVLLIVERSTICCLTIKNNVTLDCFPRERKALLRFRASFSDDPSNNMMSSWKTNSKCCAWPGVECDNVGHVVGLHLRNKDPSLNSKLFSAAVDPSLLELKYLSYLDLSGNDFEWSPIPSFLGSMKQLQYLNLSEANFAGTVPHRLGNLLSLRTLDLGGEFFYGNNLIVDDLRWAVNLSSLEYLDMSNVNLSTTKDLLKVLGMLPSLVELRLPGCELDNTNLGLISNCTNSALSTYSVKHLDLSQNSFGENFPFCFLHNMTSLSFLDLSGNNLSGPIPSFLGNLRDLRVLSLGSNNLFGPIPSIIGNLRMLIELDLNNNNLSDQIPSTLGNITALRVLYLSTNQLSGEIPVSLGQLSNLESIYMYYNSFEGTLSEAHFAKLSKLEDVIVGFESNYELKFRVRDDWVPPFHKLETLSMGYVNIGGQFPRWLQTQKSLAYLELQNCSITGTLPKWLSSFVNLTTMYLHNNHIEGPIPELPSSLEYLSLRENFINGSIPDSLCQMKYLVELDLSGNHLSGNLPDCLGNLEYLYIARLSSNQISGAIPNSIGGAYSLFLLKLNNNSLTGEIPSSLKNCTSLALLDIGENKLNGELPEWIGNHLLGLRFLILRNNTFYGDIPSAYCQLPRLRIMDLAKNQLTGNIPNCFGNLFHGGLRFAGASGMLSVSEMMKGLMLEYPGLAAARVAILDLSSNRLFGKIPLELTNLTNLNCLNLSNNHLRGKIPGNIGDMKLLESLDLSSNNLHGKIPQSLSNLTFLVVLNLSNNDFSGQIPTGPQLQTFNPSSYEGNPELCGAPLPKKCHITNNELPKSQKVENDDTDKFYLYASIITGVATGFWGYFGVLIFKRSWRLTLFKNMDALIGKMLGRY